MMLTWLKNDRVSDDDDDLASVAQQPPPESPFPRVPCRVTLTTRLSATREQHVSLLVRHRSDTSGN
jgi:hypothetical protein